MNIISSMDIYICIIFFKKIDKKERKQLNDIFYDKTKEKRKTGGVHLKT